MAQRAFTFLTVLPETIRGTTYGIKPVTETPEQFARFSEEDVKRNAELLRIANFEPQ